MSFSTDIKKELSEINNLANKVEVKFELLGYLISNNLVKEKRKIRYSTESEYNINRFAKLLRNVDINDFSIDIQGKIFNIEFKEKSLESINIGEFYFYEYDTEKLDAFLKKINNIEKCGSSINNVVNIDYVKAFIRGIFLGSGSINNPESTYHLEMRLSNRTFTKNVIDIMKNYDINIKCMDKSLYIKDGEEISKFLAFIGGSKSVIRFEEIRVQRDMNNKINRLVNCKTANLNKVLNASVEQIEAIKRLKENGKFQNLDDSLKELAELRLEHPDLSLSELGILLDKPIGKSGVNYRMKKIVDLSK